MQVVFVTKKLFEKNSFIKIYWIRHAFEVERES